jgi:hypothetical protein
MTANGVRLVQKLPYTILKNEKSRRLGRKMCFSYKNNYMQNIIRHFPKLISSQKQEEIKQSILRQEHEENAIYNVWIICNKYSDECFSVIDVDNSRCIIALSNRG